MRLFHSNKNSYNVTPVGGTSGTYDQPSSSTHSRKVPVSRPALTNSVPDETNVLTADRTMENVCNLFF